MTNSRHKQGMVLVEKYTQSSTGTTKTFTFTSDDMSRTAAYVLYFDYVATAALILRCQVNGATGSNYSTDGRAIIGGTETLLNVDNAVGAQIASATLSATASQVSGHITIQLTNSADSDRVSFITSANCPSIAGNEVTGALLSVAQTALTSITLLVSTSSWKEGARFSLYKLTR